MRSIERLKATALALLICFALQVIPATSWSAEKGIFLPYSTAQRLYVDLRYAKADAAIKGKQGNFCAESQKLAEHLAEIQDAKIKGLAMDKEAYRQEADRFKDLYIRADKDRVKAENTAPSRMRWFMVGVGTTIAAIIGVFAGAK